MTNKLALYGVLIPVCMALDYLWINVVNGSFYKSELRLLGRLSAEQTWQPVLWAAGLVYLLIPAGIIEFVLQGGLPQTSTELIPTLLRGGLFGLILYGVYDFTNHSILTGWSLKLLWVDLCWGITLCTSLTGVGLLLLRSR